MENTLLMTCLVMIIAAAGAKWQMAMIQKKRQRHIVSLMSQQKDMGRRRGDAELKVEEAILQERSTSSDIRDFTHQLSVMEVRLVELREEEDGLEERRKKHFDGDEE